MELPFRVQLENNAKIHTADRKCDNLIVPLVSVVITRTLTLQDTVTSHKVSKGAKIRNRYNQVPHLTQNTNGKVTHSQQTPQTRAKRSALSQQVTTNHI